jgi:nicotinate-nucleotide adenylyltransferase
LTCTEQLSVKAVLGGTFNPPHMGHINAALNAADALNIDQVHLMPCKIPPHKPVSVSEEHRVRMTELCCENNARLVPELIELSLPSPSYTVKTLRALKQQSKQSICFFIGADSLYNLDKWFEWEQLLKYCHLVVMRRDSESLTPNDAISAWLNEYSAKNAQIIHKQPFGSVILVDTPLYPVSSTDVRNVLRMGRRENNANTINVNEWVPRNVLDYIAANQLYIS